MPETRDPSTSHFFEKIRPDPGTRTHKATHPLDNYLDFLAADAFLALTFVNRFLARFLAAARDAFFARATRSARVMVSRLRLPPFEPICAIAFRIRLRDNVSID